MTESERDSRQYYERFLKIRKQLNRFSSYEKEKTVLNKTERKLLTILCTAETEGERLISTQIADELGVTRSAVSQMVDKLEFMRFVQRVSSPTDRKIAYIEPSEEIKRRYNESVNKSCLILERVLSRMGREEVDKLLELADDFTRTIKEVSAETAGER